MTARLEIIKQYQQKAWANERGDWKIDVLDRICRYGPTDEEKENRESFVKIEDLYRTDDETEQDFISKVETTIEVLQNFLNHLKCAKEYRK